MNVVDKKFYELADEIRGLSEKEIYHRMRTAFEAVHPDVKKSCSVFFGNFGYWGQLDADNNVFEEIELKAAALSQHIDDFVWVYEKLADYRSKKTLFAILSNWYCYDFDNTTRTKEYLFDEYFDLDLVKCSPDEVIVDLGAYTGDTVVSYIQNYGEDCYKKFYCYEITPQIFEVLQLRVASFRDIDCRLKGVGDEVGTMRLNTCEASLSANTLSSEGGEEVEVTTVDADISEPVTLIKADVEGYEQKALMGAVNHIKNDHPKLLISVYHNNEDLWKIPKMIHEISQDYKFYLRYKSSPIYPTEITLFAL